MWGMRNSAASNLPADEGEPVSQPLRVSVVVDRDDRKRREFWSEVLERLNAEDVLSTVVMSSQQL